jgi:hypothetical protein
LIFDAGGQHLGSYIAPGKLPEVVEAAYAPFTRYDESLLGDLLLPKPEVIRLKRWSLM